MLSRRARPGDVISLFGIGFGAVSPSVPAGQVVSKVNSLNQPFTLSFGQTRATVQYSGLGPNLIGLYMFNVLVPQVSPSDAIPVIFTLGGQPGSQVLVTAVE